MSAAASDGRGAASAPLTIFAIPKPFRGHIAVIQRNAIASWTRMNPRPDVILFGTDEGTAEVAAELGVRHVPTVAKNQWGTPLVSDLFAQAQQLTRSSWLCYVNADIILFDDFVAAVSRAAAWTKSFLMVGRRTDLDVTEPLVFEQENWSAQLKELARSQGRLQIARNIDYFAFSRGLYPAMPSLAIGRFWWDNWLLWKARSLGAPVVDASAVVTAIHQNHDYSHTTYGAGKAGMMASEEAILNCRLTCEQNPADFDEGLSWRYVYTIDDATHKLTLQAVTNNPRHLWKSFKRHSSRPLGMAKLVKRALFGSRQTASTPPPLREASDSKHGRGTS
ncbi:MAG TPA: hypothetical protein VKR60_15900 [Candidatus Sulfotelmatobacter sp.]|nr:hypothetical protein [Candidatus Sulfotelmatobacter sp.]